MSFTDDTVVELKVQTAHVCRELGASVVNRRPAMHVGDWMKTNALMLFLDNVEHVMDNCRSSATTLSVRTNLYTARTHLKIHGTVAADFVVPSLDPKAYMRQLKEFGAAVDVAWPTGSHPNAIGQSWRDALFICLCLTNADGFIDVSTQDKAIQHVQFTRMNVMHRMAGASKGAPKAGGK
jgi:hypothetical protein